jgi:uncharacterized spore protein YtfJ
MKGEKMDQNTNTTLNQNVDMLFTNLENFTQKEGVIGKPVIHENKTFLPVVSVTLGYGGGNSASKAPAGDNNTANQTIGNIAANMSGGALGFGAKLNTEAVIIIDKDKDNVSMISVNAPNAGLAEKIPQMLMNMGQNKQNGQQNQQGNAQNQSGQSSATGSNL